MPPEDDARLWHLVEAAEKAIGYAHGKARSSLDEDELLRLALTKLVEIVGEAAKQVSQETKASYPDVPWAAAARMRRGCGSGSCTIYFDVNLDVLWATVTVDLPALLAVVPRPGSATPREGGS